MPEQTPGEDITPVEAAKRAFAPMPASLPGPTPPPSAPMAAPASGSPAPMPVQGTMMLTQAQLQQIIQAAMSGNANAATQASSQPAAPLSEEDQRFVSALAAVHPAGRDLAVTRRESIGTNFNLIMYSYSPATGMRRDGAALVYDDGDMTHVFTGGHS